MDEQDLTLRPCGAHAGGDLCGCPDFDADPESHNAVGEPQRDFCWCGHHRIHHETKKD